MPPSTPSAPRVPESQSGQASLEYAGVLAVVAVVLVVVTGVAGGGAITNGVLGGLQRALCVVTGGACAPLKLEACTVRARRTAGSIGVKFTLVKVGVSLSVLRSEHSDGTVDVTLVDAADAAPTAGLGAEAGVETGHGSVGAGAMAQTELLVRLGRSRVWHRPDGASADRLVTRIRTWAAANVGSQAAPPGVGGLVRRLAHTVGLHGDQLPTPDISGVSAGVEYGATAKFAEAAALTAGLKASLGGSRDRRSGATTVVFAVTGEAGGRLTGAMGLLGAGAADGVTVTVTYDRAHVPVALTVTVRAERTGALGVQRLPGAVGTPPRTGSGRGGAGVRSELTARLALDTDDNRAAYERWVAALAPTRLGGLPAATATLAERVRTASRIDVARYATDEAEYGAGGEVALGGRLGGSVDVSRSRSDLLDAWTRPVGGVWEQRTDCLLGGSRA